MNIPGTAERWLYLSNMETKSSEIIFFFPMTSPETSTSTICRLGEGAKCRDAKNIYRRSSQWYCNKNLWLGTINESSNPNLGNLMDCVWPCCPCASHGECPILFWFVRVSLSMLACWNNFRQLPVTPQGGHRFTSDDWDHQLSLIWNIPRRSHRQTDSKGQTQ